MLGLLIQKELKHVLLGPKFVLTFAVCSILILLSVFVGIADYKAAVSRYEAAQGLASQKLEEATSWRNLGTEVYRKPDPMRIFTVGVTNDLGRMSRLAPESPIRLNRSVYSDNPLFAVFRFLDLAFIFQVVLSLFAILFTYNAINGEREMGTLKLTLANDVPRARYVVAKFAGSWLALTIPLMVPLLMGILMVIVMGVPVTGVLWGKLLLLLASSLLYLTFFVALGIAVSTWTRHSSASFLILLMVWVAAVLVVPRAGMMLAAKIKPAPSIAEVDGQIDAYSKTRWDKYVKELEAAMQQRRQAMEGMTEAEQQAYQDDNEWDWMTAGDAARKSVETDIENFTRNLEATHQSSKIEQENLALALSRFSPASAYLHAAMNLGGTHASMKTRYEQAIGEYQQRFNDHAVQMAKTSGLDNINGFSISVTNDGGAQLSMSDSKATIDASTIPRFEDPVPTLSDVVRDITVDVALLLVFIAAALLAGFTGFMRYDVR